MKTFEINTNGSFSVKTKTKDVYKMLIGGPIFFISLFLATKYTIDNYEYFLFLTVFLTSLYIIIFVFIPISSITRLNKVVKKIHFNEDKVIIFTNKEFVISKNELKFEKVQNRFNGFNQNGILVKYRIKKEFWIIENFYNDFENLKDIIFENLEGN